MANDSIPAMAAAKVSVIIPVYNRVEYLPETLDSIFSQTAAPAEIIIVDDGSTEPVAPTLRPYLNRIRYERLTHAGICVTRNTGVKLATNPWIAFCDSDDLWRPDKLEQQLDLISRHPGLRYCFTNFRHVRNGVWDESSKFDDAPAGYWDIANLKKVGGSNAIVSEQSFFKQIVNFNSIFPSTLLMERDFFLEIGGFDDQFSNTRVEDFEFTLRCVQRPPLGIVTNPLVGVRKHESNFSGIFYLNLKGEIRILEYSSVNHEEGRSSGAMIGEQIIKKSISAARGAFRNQDLAAFSELLAKIPFGRRDFKLRIKSWLLIFPTRLQKPVLRLILKVSDLLSG